MSTTPPTSGSTVDALFCGTAFLDVVLGGVGELPEAGTEVWAQRRVLCPGGTANNAVAAARLGLHTALVAAVGRDEAGDVVWSSLEREDHLDLRWTSRTAGLETPVTVSITDGHDRRFISHGTLAAGPTAEVVSTLPRSLACFTSLDTEVPAWVRAQRASGSVAFGDVGWDAHTGWSPAVLDNLTQLDVFVPNETEAMAYTGADTPREALRALADRVPLAVITRGRRGAIALDSGSGEEVVVHGVAGPAVDPTGAGDIFVVALMRATLAGLPLRERLTFAALCAGLSVRSLGGSASAPTVHDLRGWLAGPRPRGHAGRYDFLPALLASPTPASPMKET